jgi:pilus assembly protein CpaB
MNKNVTIVLAGGFVIALLVAMIVKAGLSGGKTDGVQILVAAKPLAVGTELKLTDVKWQNWPKDATTGMIVRKDNEKLEDAAKGQLRREVGAGEPITPSSLVKGGRGNVLAAALQPGMRAVALKVKAESMVGGFISPDDRVDVIMTYEVKADELDNPEIKQQVRKYATETILENVRVLAIDQQARKDDDKAKVGRTVTLEVDTAGAERLNLASTMAEGGLTLSLRSLGDDVITAKTRRNITTDTEISTVLQEINKLSIGGGDTTGPSNVVRVYNGETIQNMVVRHPRDRQAPETKQEVAP